MQNTRDDDSRGPIFSLTGTQLKLIAMLAMFIDHAAVVFIEPQLLAPVTWLDFLTVSSDGPALVYLIMRSIGRIAFPIFCFLLIEGFVHTRSVKAYAGRLGILALLSEVPFDLALFRQSLDWSHQNVFFTLLAGLLALVTLKQDRYRWLKVLGPLLLMVLAELGRVDYGYFGVALVVLLYLSRQERLCQAVVGALASLWEGPGVLIAYYLIYHYNGEKGRGNSRWFYFLYPAHLLIYAGIRHLLL
ncbi:TraX family protein [Aerococcus sanguinicola]|uniref:Conjugal transfer protein TraX n=1 Tax=Aerococcus sanguinicola TaxID=119206 RepID=A0A109REN2_9LACT|nr:MULTISPECIES: TraX family protein [Aerococcus]AMB93656.1 hypothetical protein AWM72_02245 [Aerococcus sanguinicola]MDK7050993.1 TraX family protein [Aerococcus sanguinicola]OFT95303.1 hypothetical protein HMPREF3090_04610 [Aerococcus sp. HMSC23C02]PKZ21616.1 hypothetical protein CYJ28_06850 [Aerococcus sanguinicola]